MSLEVSWVSCTHLFASAKRFYIKYILNLQMSNSQSKLTFYGHNCFLVEQDNNFLLIDPWLADSGAFCGSWFQYPKNHHFQDIIVNLTVEKKGYVFLTHEHEDHFDTDTLNKIDKQTTLLIPCFRDKFLRGALCNMGFVVIELDHSVEFFLADNFSIKPFISDVGVNHDSAVLVKSKEFNFLNQNDCKIFDILHGIEEVIDFYSVQFSGANSHPVIYKNYSDSERRAISKEKVQAKLNNVIDAIRLLKPRLYIPAAGPAVFPFLDRDLSLGFGNIFIHQDELHSTLLRHGIENVFYARPGDFIDDKDTSPIPPPSIQELKEYSNGLFCEWDLIPAEFDKAKLVEVVNHRLDAIWDLEFNCDYILCLKWGGGLCDLLFIDLNLKQIVDSEVDKFKKIYIVEAEPKYFSLMYSEMRWQDLSLTLRASLKRVPDIFNNYINLFLYSDVANIRDAYIDAMSIPKDRIEVVGSDGIAYLINRYCPHQGADLINAVINENNQLVCPRHSWCFDLKDSGRCISNDFTILSIANKNH
jgi:UDP-MurNAc hydroxylase